MPKHNGIFANDPTFEHALDLVMGELEKEIPATILVALTGSRADGDIRSKSDLDMIVLIQEQWRQRRRRRFGDVEFDLFIYPLTYIAAQIRKPTDPVALRLVSRGRRVLRGPTSLLDALISETDKVLRVEQLSLSNPMAVFAPLDLLNEASYERSDYFSAAITYAAIDAMRQWTTLNASGWGIGVKESFRVFEASARPAEVSLLRTAMDVKLPNAQRRLALIEFLEESLGAPKGNYEILGPRTRIDVEKLDVELAESLLAVHDDVPPTRTRL